MGTTHGQEIDMKHQRVMALGRARIHFAVPPALATGLAAAAGELGPEADKKQKKKKATLTSKRETSH